MPPPLARKDRWINAEDASAVWGIVLITAAAQASMREVMARESLTAESILIACWSKICNFVPIPTFVSQLYFSLGHGDGTTLRSDSDSWYWLVFTLHTVVAGMRPTTIPPSFSFSRSSEARFSPTWRMAGDGDRVTTGLRILFSVEHTGIRT